jgi:hypothetical protein
MARPDACRLEHQGKTLKILHAVREYAPRGHGYVVLDQLVLRHRRTYGEESSSGRHPEILLL